MAWKWWRGGAKPPLPYFVYVSDAKLEMLFEQIDLSYLERLSAEAKVDLKLASLTIKQAEQPSPTRIAKLKVVERYIDLNHRVGTVQDPGLEYFRGTMPLRWGWLQDPEARYYSTHRGYNVAFFRGEHYGHTVVLMGSRHHVLGESPKGVRSDAYSQDPAISRLVADISRVIDPLRGEDREYESRVRVRVASRGCPREAKEAREARGPPQGGQRRVLIGATTMDGVPCCATCGGPRS